MTVVVRYDRRARSALVLRYDRPKFVTQRIDFWAPGKIGQNYVETEPYVAVHCKAGRGKRAGPHVLATRAKSALVLRFGRSKFAI